jgi:hypothetical protein
VLLLLLLLQVAFSAHTRHPNIVQLLDVFADKVRRTLVIVVSANSAVTLDSIMLRHIHLLFSIDCLA